VSERKKPEVGAAIVYHDENGRPHNGLVTAVWGPYMINVVHVSDDESRQDGYGRQIMRESSVPMRGHPFGEGDCDAQCVHGRYCRYPEEDAVPFKAPQQV
jgi:hypothetical protein